MKEKGLALFFETSAKSGENIDNVKKIFLLNNVLFLRILGFSRRSEAYFLEIR